MAETGIVSGQGHGRNPNVLGQHRGKTTEWNSQLSLYLKKKKNHDRVVGLGHSAVGNGSCDWAEALWGDQGSALVS